MNLKIREGNENDYIAISNLVKEVHDLHVINRPDVYLDVDNPFEKEQFKELFSSNNTSLFVVEFYQSLGMSTRNIKMELNI